MTIDYKDFIRVIPKIELHIHLEGAIRFETLLELSHRNPISDFESYQEIKNIKKYKNLPHFINTMKSIGDMCIKCPEDYSRIAYELFQDMSSQNICYAEVSYDPIRGMRLNIPPEEIMEAVYSAKLKAEHDLPIKIGLIAGLGREHGAETIYRFSNMIAENCSNYGIIGFDLHGNENYLTPSVFKSSFDLIRTKGLGLRAHAGESLISNNIWESINDLKVTRIAHGVGAVNDEKLIDYLAGSSITLDMCPVSNYRLSIIKDYSEHPIRKFYEKGIKLTVSTDDPLYFNTSLHHEYSILHDHLGFEAADIVRLNEYAIDGSFASKTDKTLLKEKLNDFCNKYNM